MKSRELNKRNSDRKRGADRLVNRMTEAETKLEEHENRKEAETTTQGRRQHAGDRDR